MTVVLDVFKEAGIYIVNVPANMTKFYQLLDLTINGCAKQFLKPKYKLQLTKHKPTHAGWLVEFYNHMNTAKGKEIINNGWKTAGISDVLELSLSKMS